MQSKTSFYLTPASEDGVCRFKSQALLYSFLGIETRFDECIAYAPYAKYAPNCSRPLNRSNRDRRPRLLAGLMITDIPSRQAQLLLEYISRCVVCGVSGWHQPESKQIFREWYQKLWHEYILANGIDPGFDLSSPPDRLRSRVWFAALETVRRENAVQRITERGETADSSGDDDDDDDDDDAGSDDGQESLLLTPGSSNDSNVAHGEDLASILPAGPVYEFSFRAEQTSAPRPTSSSRSSSVSHASHQVVESVVSVTRRTSALRTSSARLRVYRDPVPPSTLLAQWHPGPLARESGSSTTPASTASLPQTETRRALGALDRNVNVGRPNRDPELPPGPVCPQDGAIVPGKGSATQRTPATVQESADSDDNDNQRARPVPETETVQQSDSSRVDERLGRDGSTAGDNYRRPCSRCRGTGYRVLDSGPLATEDDMLQLLGQFDVVEEEDESASKKTSSSSSTTKGFRIYPQLSPKENMQSILNTIVQHSGGGPARNSSRRQSPAGGGGGGGYIYAFARPSLPGFLNIGYTNAIVQPDRPYPDPVDFRLARWASDCGYPVIEVFREYVPCAPERMESLIYQTLREYRRIQDPVCRPCQRRKRGGGGGARGGGAHDEWFEVDVEEARQVVRSWALFSEQRPYDSFGAPLEFWAEKVAKERKARNCLGLGQWLEKIPQYVEELRRLEFRSILGFAGGLLF
ncbi:hypothetical protein N0V82_002809 [Gnomoniopsis sp. IMI 355080]|nr:hypothetical protein N0V82_002809 [Gnomoniopsis sp. IMI 355080]